mgnify:CR=1 FL=1
MYSNTLHDIFVPNVDIGGQILVPKCFFSCICLLMHVYLSLVLLCKRGITPSRYYSVLLLCCRSFPSRWPIGSTLAVVLNVVLIYYYSLCNVWQSRIVILYQHPWHISILMMYWGVREDVLELSPFLVWYFLMLQELSVIVRREDNYRSR